MIGYSIVLTALGVGLAPLAMSDEGFSEPLTPGEEENLIEVKVEDTRRIVFCFVEETMNGEEIYYCPVCQYSKFSTMNRFFDHMNCHYPVELIDN